MCSQEKPGRAYATVFVKARQLLRSMPIPDIWSVLGVRLTMFHSHRPSVTPITCFLNDSIHSLVPRDGDRPRVKSSNWKRGLSYSLNSSSRIEHSELAFTLTLTKRWDPHIINSVKNVSIQPPSHHLSRRLGFFGGPKVAPLAPLVLPLLQLTCLRYPVWLESWESLYSIASCVLRLHANRIISILSSGIWRMPAQKIRYRWH